MKSSIIHPVIGEVTISRTHRATRISLSVKADGSVRLSYPMFVSQKRALKFLDEKCDWILANRQKMEGRYGTDILNDSYRTRNHSLCFVPADVKKISVKIKDGEIVVKYPDGVDTESEEVQSAAGKGVIEALRVEAKERLPEIVERLAAEHGFSYGAVRVKASRSKWGSCTSRNDINLSLFIMLLPDNLLQYILLHELCHTVHKNHSERFHNLLDSVSGGRSKELNRELRAYRPDIHWQRR